MEPRRAHAAERHALVATRLETASDARLKDIQEDVDFPPVLDKLRDLDLKLYAWKESGVADVGDRDAGVIAQNVEAMFGTSASSSMSSARSPRGGARRPRSARN